MPTARALVVQHAEQEGPDRLAEWLPAAGVELDIRHAYAGDQVRLPAGSVAGLLVMGGPMGATDDADAPWLPDTRRILTEAVATGLPTLAICLGAQLLAVAAGGAVRRGSAGPELGLDAVAPSPAAAEDRLLSSTGPVPVPVVQWHWDEVAELPPGSVLLAGSARYPNQAFRVGRLAWGLQFHLESSARTVADWARIDADGVRAAGFDPAALAAGVAAGEQRLREVWQPVAERFAGLVRDRAADRPSPP
ncbi:MAG TPA: type 1 glutamine amidotransferase [Mycobacteriales bacterium]|nr:type 1 glutamine amidotransferase [Mycobacteriales bacterium]